MLRVKFDAEEVTKVLQEAGRQLPFATALALTKTAQDVQKDHQEALPYIYDNPTRFTINGLYVKPAKKTALFAYVGLKDYAMKGTAVAQYLKPTIEGGRREHKRFEKLLIARGVMRANEYTMPSTATKLNQYGNVSQGQIVKALANLQSLRDEYQNTKSGAVYFAGSPYKGAPRGIYLRKGRRLQPFMIFTAAQSYAPMYDFRGMSQLSLQRHLLKNAKASVSKVLAEAR